MFLPRAHIQMDQFREAGMENLELTFKYYIIII